MKNLSKLLIVALVAQAAGLLISDAEARGRSRARAATSRGGARAKASSSSSSTASSATTENSATTTAKKTTTTISGQNFYDGDLYNMDTISFGGITPCVLGKAQIAGNIFKTASVNVPADGKVRLSDIIDKNVLKSYNDKYISEREALIREKPSTDADKFRYVFPGDVYVTIISSGEDPSRPKLWTGYGSAAYLSADNGAVSGDGANRSAVLGGLASVNYNNVDNVYVNINDYQYRSVKEIGIPTDFKIAIIGGWDTACSVLRPTQSTVAINVTEPAPRAAGDGDAKSADDKDNGKNRGKAAGIGAAVGAGTGILTSVAKDIISGNAKGNIGKVIGNAALAGGTGAAVGAATGGISGNALAGGLVGGAAGVGMGFGANKITSGIGNLINKNK